MSRIEKIFTKPLLPPQAGEGWDEGTASMKNVPSPYTLSHVPVGEGISGIVFFLFCSLLCVNARATTYFVTQSGAGLKNGTSLANAWSVANYNASAAPAGGDTVFFSGTITASVAPATGGTGNGAGRLTLDFNGATLTPPAISLSNKNYLTLLGGTVSGGSDGSAVIACAYPSPGLGHDIAISNFRFTGAAGGSDTFFSVGSCTNVEISSNTIDNVSGFVNAWQGKTHDLLILNNYARTSVNLTNQSDVITLGDATNVTIQGNKLVNRAPGSQSNGRHNDIIQTFQSGSSSNQIPANWIIRYNWLEEAVTDCADTDGSNSWTMLENTGGVYDVYANVFYTSSPCYFGNGTGSNSSQSTVVWHVYNNTFASPNGYPPIGFVNSGNLNFRNNVWQVGHPNGTYWRDTWTTQSPFDHNFFYGVPECDSTVSGPHGSCSTNPLFADFAGGNLMPQTGSPLLNAADGTIGSLFNQGIAPGATWPNPVLATRTSGAWDVGAYQSTSGTTSSACDVNKDSTTNIVDVQQCVNQSLGVAACTADINKDGICNVVDVQRVVNAALGGQCVTQ